MTVTIAFPDDPRFYLPIFPLDSVWLLATGAVALRSGLRLDLEVPAADALVPVGSDHARVDGVAK